MRSRSSTFSSDRYWAVRPVPWAFLLALVLLVSVEVAVRTQDPAKVIPYESLGRLAYSAVRQHLTFLGPVDVCFVGSSRTREDVDMPLLNALVASAFDHPLQTANYSLPGSDACRTEAVVRLILRQEESPALILYGLTPASLAVAQFDLDQLASLWSLGDWWREREGSSNAVLRVLPDVLRNEIENRYRTFGYRRKASLFFKQALSGEAASPCPMLGQLSYAQARYPNRTLANRPVQRARIREYLRRRMVGDEYPLGGIQRDALESLLRLCRDAEVPIIVFELPQAELLKSALPETTYADFLTMMAEVTSEHGVPFVRLERLEVSFGETDFRDRSHLNLQGARKLTRALAARVVVPALQDILNGGAAPDSRREVP